MSVTCVVYGASDEETDALVRSPESIHAFLRAATPVEHPGCVGAFLGRRLKVLPSTRPVFDIGKSWQAIHFVLNGTKKETELPQGFILSGGQNVGDEDVGYGPARVLPASVVSQIAAFLGAVTVDEFRSRIDPARMRPLHVYSSPSTNNPADAEYLVSDFSALREFITARAREQQGIVIQYV
jgi:hypothetical protein